MSEGFEEILARYHAVWAREILSRLERKELKLLDHSHATAAAVTDELQKKLF